MATRVAILTGGPLDGQTKYVASLFLGFETNLFPHIAFDMNGEKIHYAPQKDEPCDEGGIIYRQCWFTEAKPKE